MLTELNLTRGGHLANITEGCYLFCGLSYCKRGYLPQVKICKINFLAFGLIFSLLFLCNSTIVAQQQLNGTVVTSKGTKVPFATIELYSDSTVLKKYICDSLGAFSIDIPIDKRTENIYLRAGFLKRYSSKTAYEVIAKSKTIVIVDDKSTLDEVLVSATRPLIERKADRFVFTPDKQMSQGASSLDMMRYAPFVQFDPKSEAFSIINKPGTIVLINNKKSLLPKEMIMETLRSMPADNIKSIEIITNPGSEYDANITGGIININLKRIINEGWMGVLSLQYIQSYYHIERFSGTVNYHKGRFTLQLMPFLNNDYNFYTSENDFLYAGNQQQNIRGRFFRRYRVTGGGLGIDYDISKQSFLSFKGWVNPVWGSSLRRTNTFFSTAGQSYDSFATAPLSGKDYYLYNFGNVNFRHNLNAKGDKYIDVNADYNQFVQKNDYEGSFQKFGTNGLALNDPSVYKNDLPQKFINFSQRIEYVQNLNKNYKIVAGVQNSYTRVNNNLKYYNWSKGNNQYETDSNLSNDYRYREHYYAAYVSVSARLSTQVSGVVGLRAEQTAYVSEELKSNNALDTSYLNWFPSLSLSWNKKNSKNYLSLSFSRKISRPNIETLFPGRVYYGERYFKENNPFLQPVLYSQAELTYSIKGKYNFALSYSLADHQYGSFILPVVENGVAALKSTYINYGTVSTWSAAFNFSQVNLGKFIQSQGGVALNYGRYRSKVAAVPISVDNRSMSVWQTNIFTLSKKKAIVMSSTFNLVSPYRDISSETVNWVSSLDIGFRKTWNNKFSITLLANDIYNGRSIFKRYMATNGAFLQNREVWNNYNQSFIIRLRYILGNTKVKKNKDRNIANDEIKQRT